MKYINRYSLAVCLPLVLQACGSSTDYKDVRKEVIELHDSVMIDSEKAIRSRMKLDTLSRSMDSLKQMKPSLDTAVVARQISVLKASLDSADEQMNVWMRAFEPDVADRSNEDAVVYFQDQKRQISQLDSAYGRVLKQSEQFLSDLKK